MAERRSEQSRKRMSWKSLASMWLKMLIAGGVATSRTCKSAIARVCVASGP